MNNKWSGELIRETVVEGLFYPATPKRLRTAISRKLQEAETFPGSPAGIIAPNAGFEFSGKYCAEVYKRCSGNQYQRIVLVGPDRGRSGTILLPESTLFRSPLGLSRVDSEALELLYQSSTLINTSEVSHLSEHSLEVQLPWCQYLFPDTPILPVLADARTVQSAKILVTALVLMELELGGPSLIVASVNLTNPLPKNRAEKEASQALQLILSGRWEELILSGEKNEIHSEGLNIAAVMTHLLHRSCKVECVAGGRSFEYDKNDSSVVQYASISYEREPENGYERPREI